MRTTQIEHKITLLSQKSYIYHYFLTIKDNFKMENVDKLNHYDGAEVIERFNIEKQSECTVLDNWLDVSGTLTEIEQYILDTVRQDIILTGRDWNEEELKMNFVALVFFVAKWSNRLMMSPLMCEPS